MKLWVCGKVRRAYSERSVVWDIIGIFDSETQAVKTCKTEKHFVGPVPLNKNLGEKGVRWPGVYFPCKTASHKEPKQKIKEVVFTFI